MVPCEIRLAAIDVANSSRVCSLAGMEVVCVSAQKIVNFLHPAEYVALVVGASPRVRNCWA